MRYYVSWKTAGCYRKDSLKLAARCPVSGRWSSCFLMPKISAKFKDLPKEAPNAGGEIKTGDF